MVQPLPESNTFNPVDTTEEITEAPPLDSGDIVEDITIEPEVQGSKQLADTTMSRIYETKTDGTKEEQLFQSANQYIEELFSLGKSMPELSDMSDAQRILEDMYSIESQSPLEYNPKGEISRELVDTLNGRLEGKKRVVAEMRQNMLTPQLDIVSIPEGATREQIKEIQNKVGTKADGFDGPNTQAAIKLFNKLQQEEALEASDSIDPETGLRSEVVDNSINDLFEQASTRDNTKLLASIQGEDTKVVVHKELGIPKEQLDNLLRLESGKAGYAAKNPNSSAYGKYQFMTFGSKSTGTIYAKKLGYTGKPGVDLRAWMTPERQDAMFIMFTKDNKKALKANKLEVTPFNIYGAHQQGVSGLKQILSGTPDDNVSNNIRQNLPIKQRKLKGKALADAWIARWSKEFKT